jgi:hypothetical protein
MSLPASEPTERLWMLGLPFIAVVSFGCMVFMPLAVLLGGVTLTVVSVVRQIPRSAGRPDAQSRLLLMGAAWWAGPLIYLGLALTS